MNPYEGWCPGCCDWCPGHDAEGWCLATPAYARKGPPRAEAEPEVPAAPESTGSAKTFLHRFDPDATEWEVWLDGRKVEHVHYAAVELTHPRRQHGFVQVKPPDTWFQTLRGHVEIRRRAAAPPPIPVVVEAAGQIAFALEL